MMQLGKPDDLLDCKHKDFCFCCIVPTLSAYLYLPEIACDLLPKHDYLVDLVFGLKDDANTGLLSYHI